MTLPAFPVDDATLALLTTAMTPAAGAERASLWDFLTLMSEMAGSDPGSDPGAGAVFDGVRTLRDPQYTERCVITALVAEVRRLRKLADDPMAGSPAWQAPGELAVRRAGIAAAERLVVTRADPEVWVTGELLNEWWSMQQSHGRQPVRVDGRTISFGTGGEGIGRVTYQITELPTGPRPWATMRRV